MQIMRNDLNLMFTLVLPEVVCCSINIRPYINCTQNQIKYHMHQNLANKFNWFTIFLHQILQWVIFKAFKTSWNRVAAAIAFSITVSITRNVCIRSNDIWNEFIFSYNYTYSGSSSFIKGCSSSVLCLKCLKNNIRIQIVMLEPFFNLISMAIINLLGPRFETYDPRLKLFFLKN